MRWEKGVERGKSADQTAGDTDELSKQDKQGRQGK